MSPDLYDRAITPAPRGPTFRFGKCLNTRLKIRGVPKLVVTSGSSARPDRYNPSAAQHTLRVKNRSRPWIAGAWKSQPEKSAPGPLRPGLLKGTNDQEAGRRRPPVVSKVGWEE